VRRRAAVLVVLAAIASVGACSGDGGGDEPLAAGGAESTGPTTSSEAPVTPTTAAPTSEGTAPPDGAGDASGEVTVPDAVGLDLQYAQDTMQAAGFYVLSSHDATGQDRFQVLDRNWTVCDQSPPGGTTADPATEIDFGAVKDGEACP
jgi:hypothetical protein